MSEETNIPNNSEIDKALKQFEAESQSGQKSPEISKVPPVSQNKVEGIQFEVPSYGAIKYYNEKDTPKMVSLVMKLSGGAIKEQKQAEHILLAVVCIIAVISAILIYNSIRML